VLLAAELGCAPREIAFAFSPAGKPSLAHGCGLTFNATHGDDLVAVAVSREIEVGIDVERIRPIAERAAIVRQFFHPAEARAIDALPPADAELAFFRCWTRKEAISKALGLGLSLPPDRYHVACLPSEAPALLEAAPGMPEPATWTLHDLPLDKRAVGAFASPQPGVALTHCTLDAATVLRAVADPTLLRVLAESCPSSLA
jgi:4'-phosphopantetheinyl transferase